MDLTRRFARAAAIVVAAAGLVLALRIVPYQIDDAYIVYRYAGHVAAGQGLSFNPGGPAVEGFTSPAWCLGLSAVAWALGRAALPAAAGAAGVAAWLGLLLVAARIAAKRSPASLLVAVGLLAVLPTLVFYAATGLETALFGCIVLVVAGAAAGDLPLRWGLAAGLAAIAVRPEGAYLPVMLGAQLLASRSEWRPRLRRAGSIAAAVALGGAIVVAGRLAEFGEWLPNTYYAKSGDWLVGRNYVVDNLTTLHGAGLLILALGGAVLGGPAARGYLFAGLAWIPAVVFEGGDWMPCARFLLPALVLFSLAAATLGASRFRLPVAVAASALILLQAHASWVIGGRAHTSEAGLRREAAFVADWLSRVGARSVGSVDIGWLGFATELAIVDLGGLTDRRIGQQPGSHLEKTVDLDYIVRERRPDAMILRIAKPPERGADGRLLYHPLSGIEQVILDDPGFAADYQLAFTLLPPDLARRPFYGKLVFVHRAFPAPPGAVTPDKVFQLRPESASSGGSISGIRYFTSNLTNTGSANSGVSRNRSNFRSRTPVLGAGKYRKSIK